MNKMNEIILSKEPIWFELNQEFINLMVWKYTINDGGIPVEREGIYLRIIKGGQGSIMLSSTTKPYIGKMDDLTNSTVDSIISLGENPLPLDKETQLLELLKNLPIVIL